MKMNIFRKISILIVALCISVVGLAQQGLKKFPLRVLYVGGATNWEEEAYANAEERAKDVEARKKSFEGMLGAYFTAVKVIDEKDYTQDLSAHYDVTVMDGIPKALSERKMERDASGRVTNIIPAAYLTEDFDKPMVFIGSVGNPLGRSIGVKVDWYCLCLDAHAHNYRAEHAIFKGPFKVKLTEEMRPTPADAFHYEYFLGKETPKTTKMWQVQTKGYITSPNFKVGLVARPWGFEDSPDAEFISSGVCQKTLDAVALGRHGNFFHWGFAASPEFLTKEAQIVLANSIAYTAKFDGKGIIARKYLDRRATKEYLKERKYYATKVAYEDNLKSSIAFDKKMLAIKETAEAKKAKGEKLDNMEAQSLQYTTPPEQSFADFLKRYQKDLFDKFGENEKAYAAYYDENYDYFYSEDASYIITIDDDVKSLGIPNTDHRLLEKCIQLLEANQDVDKANRILKRYTLLNYTTPDAWRTWYEKNKKKIFFTQTGGFYFMVDTNDKNEPANNYKSRQTQDYSAIKPAETSHNEPVRVAAGFVELGGGKKEIVVKVNIHPGYHIYAHVAGNDPYTKTDLNLVLSKGIEAVGELQKPSFKYFNENGTTIYEDEIIFKQVVAVSAKGEAVVKFGYQCCDSQICFQPEEESLILKL